MARDIQIKIGATDAASRVLNKVAGSVKRLDQTLLNIGTRSLKVATVAMTAFGVAAATGFALAIKSASEAQETMGKFNTVFGDSAGEVKKWSDENARAMGVSKKAMAAMLSGLQDLFVPMGLAPDLAQDMSKTLSALAVDLGSFNNIDTARVMTDLMAAMTGSGETMKKYGVIVDEASVKQELLNMKLDPKTATNAAKAQARLNIIMRGTTAAQGDAVRTSGSFANSLKAIKAEIDNLLDAIGTPFLDGLAALLQSFKGTIQGITDSIANADWDGAINVVMLKMKLETVKGLDAIAATILEYGGIVIKKALIGAFTGVGVIEGLQGSVAGAAGDLFGAGVAEGGLAGLKESIQKELDAAIAAAAATTAAAAAATKSTKQPGGKADEPKKEGSAIQDMLKDFTKNRANAKLFEQGKKSGKAFLDGMLSEFSQREIKEKGLIPFLSDQGFSALGKGGGFWQGLANKIIGGLAAGGLADQAIQKQAQVARGSEPVSLQANQGRLLSGRSIADTGDEAQKTNRELGAIRKIAMEQLKEQRRLIEEAKRNARRPGFNMNRVGGDGGLF